MTGVTMVHTLKTIRVRFAGLSTFFEGRGRYGHSTGLSKFPWVGGQVVPVLMMCCDRREYMVLEELDMGKWFLECGISSFSVQTKLSK
jgi:hypothetical protein